MACMFILSFSKVQQSSAFFAFINNHVCFLGSLLYFSENCLCKELLHIKWLCVRKWITLVLLETIDPVGWVSWENKNHKENAFDKVHWLIQFLSCLHAGFCWVPDL